VKTIGLKQDDPLQGAELPIPHALFAENQTTGCFPGLKGNAEELTSVGLVVAAQRNLLLLLSGPFAFGTHAGAKYCD